MVDKLWKKTERTIAQILGGERIPVSGRQRGFSPDIRHPYLSIEVKHRDILPGWLHEAMDQAELASQDEHPIVVLHEKGQKHDNDFVVMRLSEFKTWVQGLEVENEGLLEELRQHAIGM